MRDTNHDRENLTKAWMCVMSVGKPDAIESLQQLIPVVQSLLAHVDELQVEIKSLKEKLL